MRINLLEEGFEFSNSNPQEVVEFLESRQIEKIETSPSELKIMGEGDSLRLRIMNGTVKEYPIRRAFLYKLLRWHKFPISLVYNLSVETISSICNDLLINIRGDSVFVKIENGQALTILSKNYNEITDLEILKSLSNIGINKISRNDFFMSVNTEEKYKIKPFPGDYFGVGINILNSETGFRALTVKQFLFRYYCSNGAYTSISDDNDIKRYHYGNENLQKFLLDKFTKVKENIDSILEKLSKLNSYPVDEDRLKNIEKGISIVLGSDKAKNFLKDFNPNKTVFDLFNYITERAKGFDLSKRYFLENFAGEMLNIKELEKENNSIYF
jgi:hypothetical protein